jgi:hypothetical protein
MVARMRPVGEIDRCIRVPEIVDDDDGGRGLVDDDGGGGLEEGGRGLPDRDRGGDRGIRGTSGGTWDNTGKGI